LILHNTLESLIDTVHVFRHQRFFFRPESRKVSIHYVIGRDGSVIKMVPENRVAYHAGNANASSIGIELVANVAGNPDRGHDKPRTWDPGSNRPVLFDAGGITIAQYYSLLGKIADIMEDNSNDIDSFADVNAHRQVNSGTKCPSAVWWPAGSSFEQWRDRSLPTHMGCLQQNRGNIRGFIDCIGFG
jgi:N-acetyl-anhydromuramyl-L-alanine amidase AmpD